jgi:linear primary-alkylsulfatase
MKKVITTLVIATIMPVAISIASNTGKPEIILKDKRSAAIAPVTYLDISYEKDNYRPVTDLKQKFTLPKALWEMDVSASFANYDRAKAHDEAIQAADTVHEELKDFQKRIRPAIYKIGDNIYQMEGFEFTNSTIIEGKTGLIAFDTHYNNATARKAFGKFRKVTGITKPVHTIIYSHHHPDQHSGTAAYVSPEDVSAGKINVIAHTTFIENLSLEGGFVSPIMSQRSIYPFGALLELSPTGFVNQGVGTKNEKAFEDRAKGTFTATPNITFDDKITVKIDGVIMEMFHVPGEAPDHIAIYMPDSGTLLAGDTIQGETIPNLYTIRGAKYRDPQKWVDSIDRMRRYHPTGMTNHHGRAVIGVEDMDSILIVWRDALQFMHDQSVRLMNEGLTRDELAENIKLPAHIASHDYLRPVRGSVEQNVRSIYSGYLGWYQGDPTEFAKPKFKERAAFYTKAMGGRDKIIKIAKQAIDEGRWGWAMDVTTWVIRDNPADMEVRAIKAEAMRQWAYEQSVPGWRHWALTAAIELEKYPKGLPSMAHLLGMGIEHFYKLDHDNLFKILRVKFDPDKVDTNLELVNLVLDGNNYVFGIRNGNLIANAGTMKGIETVTVSQKAFVDAFFVNGKVSHPAFQKIHKATRAKITHIPLTIR